MARTAKIAVSLDAPLLASVERLRERTGESRSAVVSRALRALTREVERARLVEEYVEAYRAHPESADEVSSARAATKRSVAHLPWDEE